MTHQRHVLAILFTTLNAGALTACATDSTIDVANATATATAEPGATATELVIATANADRFDATLQLDGEQIRVHSEIVEPGRTEAAGLDASARARSITITSDSGAVYARYAIDLASQEVVGEMGGASFGRLADADTDMDSSHWAPIRATHAGDVIRLVSAAAQTAVNDLRASEAADTVRAVAQMTERLDVMADVTPACVAARVTPYDGNAYVQYLSGGLFRGDNWQGDMVAQNFGQGTHYNVAVRIHEWNPYGGSSYWSSIHYDYIYATVKTAIHGKCARTKGWWPNTTHVRWSDTECH